MTKEELLTHLKIADEALLECENRQTDLARQSVIGSVIRLTDEENKLLDDHYQSRVDSILSNKAKIMKKHGKLLDDKPSRLGHGLRVVLGIWPDC